MTVTTKVIDLILSRTSTTYVEIESGTRLQIVPNFTGLPYCQRNQSAALIASHSMLLVWEDDPQRLLSRTQSINEALVTLMNDDAIEKSAASDFSDSDGASSHSEDSPEQPRRLVLWQTCYISIAVCMLMVTIGSGWRLVIIEQSAVPNWFRLFFILALPAQVWLSLVRSAVPPWSNCANLSSSFSKLLSAISHRCLGP
jgi:hypothetical protein